MKNLDTVPLKRSMLFVSVSRQAQRDLTSVINKYSYRKTDIRLRIISELLFMLMVDENISISKIEDTIQNYKPPLSLSQSMALNIDIPSICITTWLDRNGIPYTLKGKSTIHIKSDDLTFDKIFRYFTIKDYFIERASYTVNTEMDTKTFFDSLKTLGKIWERHSDDSNFKDVISEVYGNDLSYFDDIFKTTLEHE